MAQNSPLASVASGGDDGTFITPRPDVTAELVALADRDLLTAGRKAYSPDPALHDPLVGRLKALAGMGVAEKRLPQDGGPASPSGGQRRMRGGTKVISRTSTISE